MYCWRKIAFFLPSAVLFVRRPLLPSIATAIASITSRIPSSNSRSFPVIRRLYGCGPGRAGQWGRLQLQFFQCLAPGIRVALVGRQLK